LICFLIISIYLLLRDPGEEEEKFEGDELDFARRIDLSSIQSAGKYKAHLELAIECAREGGKLIKSSFKKAKEISTKSSPNDLVTEVDHAVEKIISKMIKSKFPDHLLIGEETEGGISTTLGDSPTWIIDPIDGTTNFVHSFPFVAVSIALAINKKMVLGVVYNPILDELYCATEGGGSYLNGQKINAARETLLQQSLVAVGFPQDRSSKNLNYHLHNLKNILEKCRDARRSGAASLDICSVASGRLDVYFEQGVKIWDYAAGKIIATEAGAFVVDPFEDDSEFQSAVLVGNPTLVSKFLNILKSPETK